MQSNTAKHKEVNAKITKLFQQLTEEEKTLVLGLAHDIKKKKIANKEVQQ